MAGWADAAHKELAAYSDAVHRIAATLEGGLGLEPDARIRLSVGHERATGEPARRDPVTRDAPGRAR